MATQPRVYSPGTLEALSLLGRQIKLARKQCKMSEADLATRVGIARSTVQLTEKGTPKAEIRLVFEDATLLGVPCSRLSQGVSPRICCTLSTSLLCCLTPFVAQSLR